MRGGLGNQLFILSFAYRLLAESKETQYEIVLDDREYKHYKIRSLEIDRMVTDNSIRHYDKKKDKSFAYDFHRFFFHIFQFFFKSDKARNKVFSRLSKKGLYFSGSSTESYSSPIGKKKIYIYGYFQNAQSVIQNLQYFKRVIGFPETLDKNCISVSVRCGKDYVNGGWEICSKDYYLKAIDYIFKHKRMDSETNILVFSDDVEKAKSIINIPKALFVEEADPIKQLFLMAESSDFVISNSSFAWWGAILGKKNNSIIVAPYIWHSSGDNILDSNLFVDGMYLIENR